MQSSGGGDKNAGLGSAANGADGVHDVPWKAGKSNLSSPPACCDALPSNGELNIAHPVHIRPCTPPTPQLGNPPVCCLQHGFIASKESNPRVRAWCLEDR